MNKFQPVAYLILCIAILLVGCRGSVKVKNKDIESASPILLGQKYSIDMKQSVITWKGSMRFDIDEEHVGYVYLSKGELGIENGKLVGGSAEINMNSIEYKNKASKNTPIKHLKSADYFDVAKYPISTIAITKVESVRGHTIIVANLTLKGVKHPVSFPVKMVIQNGIVKANGKLIIDRTDWGIRYRSGKFYDDLADQAVSDDVELYINIIAKR